MGEALPFTPRHIDDGWQGTPQSKQMEHPPSFYVRNNIYVTTSANCSLEALLCALLAVNADHILFSTDYLYAPLDRLSRCIGNRADR